MGGSEGPKHTQEYELLSAAHHRLGEEILLEELLLLLGFISPIYEMGFALPSRPLRIKEPIHRKSLLVAGITAGCRGNHCSCWNH